MKQQVPYIENNFVLDSPYNITFQQALLMEDDAFRSWALGFRRTIKKAWDDYGVPPMGAQSEDEISKQFQQLVEFDVDSFLQTDSLTYEENVILNTVNIGTACNQFFPTMLKTRDISAANLVGVSVYDYFASNKLKETFIEKMQEHLQTDDMYLYSTRVEKSTAAHGVSAQTGKAWIETFAKRPNRFDNYDYWLEPKLDKKRFKSRTYLTIKNADVKALYRQGHIKPHQAEWVHFNKDHEKMSYRVRLYDTRKKVFPMAQQVFRKGFGLMPATNFPPLSAKFIYQTFTEHIKDQDQIVVYDPSAGWGGRILGAMSLCNDRNIHYVGNDPNQDHWMDELGITKYAFLANYFNSVIRSTHQNTYEIFTTGSEIIDKDRRFHKYKGQIDFIFTSPPYFAAEAYSEDASQSYKKFDNYAAWRDGFLRRTLEIAVEYLKRKRYLCWNIADVALGGKMLPMESDTREILEDLGMEYKGLYKMALKATTATHKLKHSMPTTRNFCNVNGVFKKYEPVFVFWKK